MIAKSATAVAFAMPLILSSSVSVPVVAHGASHQPAQAFSAYGSAPERTIRLSVKTYDKNKGSHQVQLQGRSRDVPLIVEEQLDLEEFAEEFQAWSELSRSIAEESFGVQASAVRGHR